VSDSTTGDQLLHHLVRLYLDPATPVPLDPEAQGRYLAGKALHDSEQALGCWTSPARGRIPRDSADGPLEIRSADGPDYSAVADRALSIIGTKIRTATTDLSYREALRVAQRLLEEVAK